jgi:F420-non-reducing hydrogenase iron-sulfur subunit
MQKFLEYNGVDPQRFQARWISGSEAEKFKQTMIKISEEIKAIGPNRKLRDAK